MNNYETFSGRFSTQLAFASFGIGTFLLGLHILNPNAFEIYISGLLFVILAVVFNFLMLVRLLYETWLNPLQRDYYIAKILILLANIPIAILYAYLVFCAFPYQPEF